MLHERKIDIRILTYQSINYREYSKIDIRVESIKDSMISMKA